MKNIRFDRMPGAVCVPSLHDPYLHLFPPLSGSWSGTVRKTAEVVSDELDLDRKYRSHSEWLRRRLTVRFGSAAPDMEDLVQESFLRLARYSIEDRSRHPRALLLRIAFNLAHDRQRHAVVRGYGVTTSLDDRTTQNVPTLVSAADQDFLLDLKQTVLGLPEHLKDTFILARFTPMTHAEIAQRLGISTKTVEWRINRAVAICLERLGR